ncbi:MAG: GPR endopeptidase [Ruminococcaceae bacterium]|nr:GPR endopeptidase [Oscillospiraceae bacterium]
MFEVRTDMAVEAHEIASKNKNSPVDGVIFEEEDYSGYKMTRVEIINETGEKETGKPIGKYLTLQTGKLWEEGIESLNSSAHAVASLLLELCAPFKKSDKPILVIGLGNITITADAIGPKSVSHIIVTRHLKEEMPDIFSGLGLFDIAALSPGVLGQTGIEASDIVKSVAEKLKPAFIIAIDALAARDISRLGCAIQLTDTGIAPGSGIGNKRSAIDHKNIGVPVISIGIPTVVDAMTLTANIVEKLGASLDDISKRSSLEDGVNFYVSPKDADRISDYMSKVVGYAINMAFHDKLEFEEMISIAN